MNKGHSKNSEDFKISRMNLNVEFIPNLRKDLKCEKDIKHERRKSCESLVKKASQIWQSGYKNTAIKRSYTPNDLPHNLRRRSTESRMNTQTIRELLMEQPTHNERIYSEALMRNTYKDCSLLMQDRGYCEERRILHHSIRVRCPHGKIYICIKCQRRNELT